MAANALSTSFATSLSLLLESLGAEFFHSQTATPYTADNSTWTGGWTVVYDYDSSANALVILASADPNDADSDDDTILDQQEYTYGYNPNLASVLNVLSLDAALSASAVDASAPETTLNDKPAAVTTSTTAHFSFSSDDLTATFECALDGGAFIPCTSPADYTSLGEGGHTFNVRSGDAAGNSDPTPASYGWTINLISPTVLATVSGTQDDNGWYIGDVTVSWSVTDNSLPISSSTGCQITIINTDTASTTLTCAATNAGGTSSASVTVKRDATPPTISGSATPAANAAGWHNSPVTVSFTCGDTTAGVTTCGPDQVVSGAARDNAGNTATTSVSNLHLDQMAPETFLGITPPASLYQQVQGERTNLTALLPSIDSKSAKTVQKAINKLDQVLAANLWQADGNHLTSKGKDALARLRDAVRELVKFKNPPTAVTTAITTLGTVARTIAETALNEAIAASGDAKLIAKAQKELTQANQDLAKNKLADAMAHYPKVWEFARKALGQPVLAASDLADPDAEAEHIHEGESEDESTEDKALGNSLFLPIVAR